MPNLVCAENDIEEGEFLQRAELKHSQRMNFRKIKKRKTENK